MPDLSFPLRMPSFDDTGGIIVARWLKAVGEKVGLDEPLVCVRIGSDAETEILAPFAGVLDRIDVDAGDAAPGDELGQIRVSENPEATAQIREMVREATSAYELAVATTLRAEREEREETDRRLAALAAEEKTAYADLDQAETDAQARATADLDRAVSLAIVAGQLREAAGTMLERSSLAHVIGLDPRTGDPDPVGLHPHERLALAFADAQRAAVELHAALIRLAEVHLDAGRPDEARTILDGVTPACLGPLREEIGLQMRRISTQKQETIKDHYLAEVTTAIESGDPHTALTRAHSLLQQHSGDALLRDLAGRSLAELAAQCRTQGDHDRARGYLANAEQYGWGGHRIAEAFGTLAWWRAPSVVAEFGGHAGAVLDVAFSADGRTLASVDGHELKEWNLAPNDGSGYLRRTISEISAELLSADGTAAAHRSGAVWEASGGSRSEPTETGPTQVNSLSDDGSVVVRAGDRTDARGRRITELVLSEHGAELIRVPVQEQTNWVATAVNVRRRLLAVLDMNGLIAVHAIDSGQRIHTLRLGQTGPSPSGLIALSLDGTVLLAALPYRHRTGHSTWVQAWNTTTGAIVHSGAYGDVGAIAISPNGDLIALGVNASASVSDIASGHNLYDGRYHADARVRSIAFSSDGLRLAVACNDQTIRVVG